LFSGNAGTYDVSVMDFQQALAGEPVVEIAPRVPVQVGPFGIQASPNRKLIAVTARERADIDFLGNTISIIDVDLARTARPVPNWPEYRSGLMIRTVRRGLSQSLGHLMDERLSSPIMPQTTYPSST
jgi:hypothetical protein